MPGFLSQTSSLNRTEGRAGASDFQGSFNKSSDFQIGYRSENGLLMSWTEPDISHTRSQIVPRQRADLSYWTVAVLVIALSYWGLHSQSRLQTVYAVEKESQPSEHQETQDNNNSPSTVDEARGRARLLHETIHGSLQIMHRDFFREDEGLPIPSHSLEDVFNIQK